MQVDCFKRNWKTSVCSKKCKFRYECEREWVKYLYRKIYGEMKR